MTEYALIEFMDDNTLEVVHTADIEFKNDGMLQSDFSAWNRAKEFTVSWGSSTGAWVWPTTF